MIHRLEAELQLSAPLIMAGQAPLEKNDSLRPSAIKGALRFWWRALQWPSLRAQHGTDKEALKALHRAESELFGAAAGDHGQQSKVLLRLGSHRLDEVAFANEAKLKESPGVTYLLGQGKYDRNKGCVGAGLLTRKPLLLSLIWRADQLDELQAQGVIAAVQALGLLGSVGARARKGFGSLSLQRLTLDGNAIAVPQNVAELGHWFASLSRVTDTGELPPFTALSQFSRCWALGLKPASSGLGLLNEYGLQMTRYRGSDKSLLGGQSGLGLFKSDSRELRKITEKGRPAMAPRRAVFGLPNNVFFIDSKQTVEVKPADKDHERRASPLFAHLHQFPGGERVMLATLLPAQFLPPGEGIIVAHNGAKQLLPFEPDWNVITHFIEQQCNGQELTS